MRSPGTQQLYENYLSTNPDVNKSWSELPSPLGSIHWKVIKNQFPYDALNISRHDLLIPKRRFSKLEEATPEELADLVFILEILDKLYSYTRQNTTKGRTVTSYFHIHLIREKGLIPEKDVISDSEDFSDSFVEIFKRKFINTFGSKK